MEPDKRTIRRYLRDADYPANQQDLVSTAQSKGAPTALLERLSNLQKGAEFPIQMRSQRRWSART